MQDGEGGVHVGKPEVDRVGGEDTVPLQQTARHLVHVLQAPEVLEVYILHGSRAKFLQANQTVSFRRFDGRTELLFST